MDIHINLSLSESEIKQIVGSAISELKNADSDFISTVVNALMKHSSKRGKVSVTMDEESKKTSSDAGTISSVKKIMSDDAANDIAQKVTAIIVEDLMFVDADFNNIAEVNKMLDSDVKRICDIINVRFGIFKGNVLANFRETECMRLRHSKKWTGYVKLSNISEEIRLALIGASADIVPAVVDGSKTVNNDEHSTELLTTHGRKFRHARGYNKISYTRIAPNSNIIRMRKIRTGKHNGPMLIDREFANDMFEKHLTNVSVASVNPDSVDLLFTKETVMTPSPRNSDKNSKLRVHAVNQSSGVPTTFCINGVAFQNTIMNAFNTSLNVGEEAMFKFSVIAESNNLCRIRMKRFDY